ncbi:Kynurenine formamidase [Planctomycetes bacterium CA13]|uniref:Kynurenine formamidase n=1 Tax=Novipirellula herctigrandis TaxID=2527986 RepID=A0A5C5ZBG6_9BACT|nr:Kynurenine formamidase [Planctomycetes bacterium CA13]
MMRVIDLSLPVNNDMPGVAISPAKRIETEGWNATTLSLYSHCGTHMDAPWHFVTDGATLDQQNLDACVGDAIVVNVAPARPKQLLAVEDLGSLADSIAPGDRLLFRTDWYKRYGTPEYRNELPRIGMELAEWLVNRQVAMIGVEPPSVADVNNARELTDVHQTLFRGNVLIVEGLANLDKLSDQIVEFIALPLKIVGGDGSPVRAIAIERRGES